MYLEHLLPRLICLAQRQIVQTPQWSHPGCTTAGSGGGSTAQCLHHSSSRTQRRASTQMRCHTQSQLVCHRPPPFAVRPLLGQPDLGQAADLTPAVAAGADQERTCELGRLQQCFQYQAHAEAAAPFPAAAAATARSGEDKAAGAADQPAHVEATRCEVECHRLTIDVPVAAAIASHVTACCPALDSALVASCAPALHSVLGPAPDASHQRAAAAAAAAAAASSWKLPRQLLAAVSHAAELPGSHQTLGAARLIAVGPAEHLRTLWAPIQHTETWPVQPAPIKDSLLTRSSR